MRRAGRRASSESRQSRAGDRGGVARTIAAATAVPSRRLHTRTHSGVHPDQHHDRHGSADRCRGERNGAAGRPTPCCAREGARLAVGQLVAEPADHQQGVVDRQRKAHGGGRVSAKIDTSVANDISRRTARPARGLPYADGHRQRRCHQLRMPETSTRKLNGIASDSMTSRSRCSVIWTLTIAVPPNGR